MNNLGAGKPHLKRKHNQMSKKQMEESNKSLGKGIESDNDDFENPSIGEAFGGSYPNLELSQGEVSGMLTFVKESKIALQNEAGETEILSIPVANDGARLVSLPLNAVFKKHYKEANLNAGDVFRIKRYPDSTKKRGKGAGNIIKVFALKVYTRASASA